MKSIYKKGALLAAAALMAFAITGCGGSGSNSKTAKDTLTVGVTNFADSLEPTDNYFGWHVMRYGIGECLVHFDDKMNAEPWIAESWKVSDDKMSWTFKIKDIKFSNGTPVTGEAVKKSIERTFAKAPRAKAMFELDHITADGQNVTIYTKKPVATLPGMLGDPLFIIVDTDSDGKVDFAKQGPVSTGPYMVKSFSKAKTELDANPHYYDKVPFAHAQINTIDDPNTRAMALQKGDQDLAKKALAKKVKADEELASYKQMYESISAQTNTIGEQVEILKTKLEEAKSRQAMLIARSQMAQTKRQLAAAQSNFDSSSAFAKLDRMEEKVMQQEAEADAYTEITGGNDQDELSEQFAQMENDAQVDAELQRLMSEMGINEAPAQETEAPQDAE